IDTIVSGTRAGILERFRVPDLEPGQVKDDLVLRLKDWSILEIELVDAAGKRIDRANPRFTSPKPTLFEGRLTHVYGSAAKVTVELGAVVQASRPVTPDPTGILRFRRAASFGGRLRVSLRLDGYRTGAVDLG